MNYLTLIITFISYGIQPVMARLWGHLPTWINDYIQMKVGSYLHMATTMVLNAAIVLVLFTLAFCKFGFAITPWLIAYLLVCYIIKDRTI